MGWGGAIGAIGAWEGYLSSHGARAVKAQTKAQEEALKVQRQHYEQAKEALMQGDYSGFTNANPMPLLTRRTKCDSCGSREFKVHHGQSVCTYCRSTG